MQVRYKNQIVTLNDQNLAVQRDIYPSINAAKFVNRTIKGRVQDTEISNAPNCEIFDLGNYVKPIE